MVKKLIGFMCYGVTLTIILVGWAVSPLKSQDLPIPQCHIVRSLQTWVEVLPSEGDGLLSRKVVHVHVVEVEKLGLAFNIRDVTPTWPLVLMCYYPPRD